MCKYICYLIFIATCASANNCGKISILNESYPLGSFDSASYNVIDQQLIYVGHGCKLTNESVPPNFIAVADRGNCEFTTKAECAIRSGASALIVINYDNNVAAMPGIFDIPLVTLMVDHKSGVFLKEHDHNICSIVLMNCDETGKTYYLLSCLVSIMVIIGFVIMIYLSVRRCRTYHQEYILTRTTDIDIDKCCNVPTISTPLPQDRTCAICIYDVSSDDINNNSNMGFLLCGHLYHKDCIEQWFRTKGECPICKRKYPPEEV
jgi:hypothetical protein